MVAYGVDASQINFPNGNVDDSKVHNQVVAIDPYNMTVTLNLVNGFSFGRPIWYISMDASIPLAAAIEHNTYAPLMDKLLLGMTTASAARLSASSSPRTVLKGATVHNVRVYPPTWPMVTGRTILLAEFRRSRWTTARPGTHSCTRGPMMQYQGATVSNCEKSSKFSPMRKMA